MSAGISVVVAATWSNEAAERTSASVAASAAEAGLDVEIIVAAEPGRDVAELRQAGAARANAPIVAFVEDSCVVTTGWVRAIVSAFIDPRVLAATGGVRQARGSRAVDWAVYFAEYAPFCRGGDGVARRLAGPNFAIRRDRFSLDRPILEVEIAAEARGAIRSVKAAEVVHVRRYDFQGALADRWRFGRGYGGGRWNGRRDAISRLGRLAAPAILARQSARLAAAAVRSPGLVAPLARSAPLTFAMLTAWSAGEAWGWSDHRAAMRRYERAGRSLA